MTILHVHDLIPTRRSLIRVGAICAAVLAFPLTTHLTPAAAMTRHVPQSRTSATHTAHLIHRRFVLPPAWSGIFVAERRAAVKRTVSQASIPFGTTVGGCAVTSASVG